MSVESKQPIKNRQRTEHIVHSSGNGFKHEKMLYLFHNNRNAHQNCTESYLFFKKYFLN